MKKRALTADEQSARFVEAAKRLDADDREKQFEKAFKKIISPQARGKKKKPP